MIKELSVDKPLLTEPSHKLNDILDKYCSVFSEKLGTLVDIRAKLSLDKDATPKFSKVRQVLYSLKPKVEAELKRMEESWPVSNVTDGRLFTSMGDKFSKIDLRSVYLQMEMDEDSQKYTTINTHLGLYQYNQLVFGVEAAPAIWQRTME